MISAPVLIRVADKGTNIAKRLLGVTQAVNDCQNIIIHWVLAVLSHFAKLIGGEHADAFEHFR